jgi:phosphoglycerate kinase
LAHLLPKAVGKLFEAELDALHKALDNPQRPAMAIVGGAKVSSKVDVLGNLLKRVDVMVIGGGMANTFLLAQGIDIGKSFCDRESVPIAAKILEISKMQNRTIILPIDAVTASELKAGVKTSTHPINAIPSDQMILDIGPATEKLIQEKLQAMKTVVWNGPLGVFETPPFDHGTVAVAQEVAKLSQASRLLSVAGGGDTASALQQAGVADQFTYMSTAGGAFLEWLEGKELPGVTALMN